MSVKEKERCVKLSWAARPRILSERSRRISVSRLQRGSLEPTIVSLSVDERRLLDRKLSIGALLGDAVNVPQSCHRYGFAFAIAKICRGFLKYSFFIFWLCACFCFVLFCFFIVSQILFSWTTAEISRLQTELQPWTLLLVWYKSFWQRFFTYPL